MLTNRLEFNLEVDGETSKLTRDELMSHAFSPRAELRESGLPGALPGLLAARRTSSARSTSTGAQLVRRAGGAARLPLAPSRCATRQRHPRPRRRGAARGGARERGLFQRYFRLKAGWLGMERLRRYDLYAPLATSDREVGVRRRGALGARDLRRLPPALRRATPSGCSPKTISTARSARASAAAPSAPPCCRVYTPWVLVNFAGRVRDVATLAHELGHAIHSMLAERLLRSSPSTPRCRWPRPPRCSARC